MYDHVLRGPTNGCLANTITSPLVATNNAGRLVIVGNTVAGAVTQNHNRGTSPLGQPVTVVGNHHEDADHGPHRDVVFRLIPDDPPQKKYILA